MQLTLTSLAQRVEQRKVAIDELEWVLDSKSCRLEELRPAMAPFDLDDRMIEALMCAPLDRN